MSYVVGIDPSLTKAGIGIVHDDGHTEGHKLTHRRPVGKPQRIKAGLPETPTLTERYTCLHDAALAVAEAASGATLVVIYDSTGSAVAPGAVRQDWPAHWWAIISKLLQAEIPVARVMDVSVRKAITGKGNHGGRDANKVATALAVRNLHPDVEIVSDDVADALAAAHLGAVALGWAVPTLAGHRTVKWSEWPSLPDPTAKGAA